MYKPQTRLKNEMRELGITPHEVAMRLNRPYSTIQQWLNGYSAFPEYARNTINQMIAERRANGHVRRYNTTLNQELTTR